MAETQYKIDDYIVEIYAFDAKGLRTRWGQLLIRLFSGGREIAQAVFGKEDSDIPEPYLSGDKIYYFAGNSQYAEVMDLLRNEKEVYITWKPIYDPKEKNDGDAFFHTSL